MPLIEDSPALESFSDPALSADDRTSITSLISAELPPDHKSTPHSSLSALPTSGFSELVEKEHARLASGSPREPGVDLTRYEALDPPASNAPDAWRTTLQQSYNSSAYLSSRLQNLSLLEKYGKNAWLVGNSLLEDELKGLEKEVTTQRMQTDDVDRIRRAQAEEIEAERRGLDESWKAGVRRMLEVEVAAEGIRREILERKRASAR
ncbi:hypothetical protein LTR66_014570 [Elasticomyces elasticus]|nr:hypothetical protein LTR66_014570 [Elasticomyces elasticus]